MALLAIGKFKVMQWINILDNNWLQEAQALLRNIISIDGSEKAITQDIKEVNEAEGYFKDVEENIKRGNYTLALSYIQKLQTICPDFEQLIFKRIEILVKMDKVADAVKLSTDLMNDHQNNVDFLYARALAIFYNGQA